MRNRVEEIKSKGFNIVQGRQDTDFQQNTGYAGLPAADFAKIKVGAKMLDDAVFNLGDYQKVNPRLAEIENELAMTTIKTAKAILISNEKEKNALLADLKKQTNSLIKEKNSFIKNLSKENNYLIPHFECKLCKDTGYVQKDGKVTMCTCLKQRIFDIAYNKSNMGNLERENFSSFNIRIFSDKADKELYKSE